MFVPSRTGVCFSADKIVRRNHTPVREEAVHSDNSIPQAVFLAKTLCLLLLVGDEMSGAAAAVGLAARRLGDFYEIF